MVSPKARAFLQGRARNDAYFDLWSIVHVVTGVLGGWVMDPFLALLIMVLWEPLEILVLSPLLAHFGIIFGHESLRNSLSDIACNSVGVASGFYLLREWATPPFTLF